MIPAPHYQPRTPKDPAQIGLPGQWHLGKLSAPMEQRLETGSYILRSLIQGVALSQEGEDPDVRITCVEFYGLPRAWKKCYSS
jgi:hypothetical protein